MRPLLKPGEMDARGRLIYVHEGGRLMITKPINGTPATAANGGTIGIAAATSFYPTKNLGALGDVAPC